MSKPYKKTAKDLAFDRERAKLNATIQKQKDQIFELTRSINAANMEIESLKMTITVLEGALQIPREDLIANMERTRKIASFVEIMSGRAAVEIEGMYEDLGLK